MQGFFWFAVVLAMGAVSARAQAPDAPQVSWSTGLRAVQQVQLVLPSAVIALKGEGGPREGRLEVRKSRGGDDCKAAAALRDGVLYIGEEREVNRVVPLAALPVAVAESNAGDGITASLPHQLEARTGNNCVYQVQLELHHAAELRIVVPGEAQVELERWPEAVTVRLGTGYVAFGEVGDFDLECRGCDFGGEGLNGTLRYRIGVGTVGIRQLTDSVDGMSKGDVMLLWRKLGSASKVAVTSSAGDVAVGLPVGRGLTLSLKAPRGEVYSKRVSTTVAGGVPVDITAEAGTIRVRN